MKIKQENANLCDWMVGYGLPLDCAIFKWFEEAQGMDISQVRWMSCGS